MGFMINHRYKLPKFISGTVIERLGTRTFKVRVDGVERVYHRHQIQFRNRAEDERDDWVQSFSLPRKQEIKETVLRRSERPRRKPN